jgi:AcrR family transcriptional regulator
VSAPEVPVEVVPTATTRRELAVARALDQRRSRAENRVQLFLDAALELMNDNSGEFTVQEVVERSGQSLRTFYQYFGGKHELLLALFEESVRAAAAHLQDVVAEGDDPIDRLHRFAVEYFRMCRLREKGQTPRGPAPAVLEFAQVLLTSHPREAAHAFAPLVEMLEGLLADAMEAGVVRADLDGRRVAGTVLQATMFNAVADAISGPPVVDGAIGAEALWDLLFRGIGTGD